MPSSTESGQPTVILVAGLAGAIGSTLSVAVHLLKTAPHLVKPYLTTEERFAHLPLSEMVVAGWDLAGANLCRAIEDHGVIPASIWQPLQAQLETIPLFEAPEAGMDLDAAIAAVSRDIDRVESMYPQANRVLVNLLPAAPALAGGENEADFRRTFNQAPDRFPDPVYALAAIHKGIPVVNFTPNEIEWPWVVQQAAQQGVPLCGRDGKTGQTFYKLVLASAWKARKLKITGWYSLNILGNSDGANLMDPERAAGKLANKTEILEEILGYRVGDSRSCHKVHIDYYPPRGDAKEAWDVVDFEGLFDLPMSIRIDFQGRDSVLAAPMAIDMARWMVALKQSGRNGLVADLAFFFKKPLGLDPPLSYEDQISRLNTLDLT
ncbi:inositol-3-phosphate synthase [Desulfatirhabdium butyrativorans]|uniref:inositol-3-phosphate synthase n=1 Tax=Desulfatirhabdium butyrativorans TaxID=340467 RepID=UPI0006854377|nr:inositol-3-phosphate synthase [Desulfatirhabdium butyrativorans]